jgi:hypothetical protein
MWSCKMKKHTTRCIQSQPMTTAPLSVTNWTAIKYDRIIVECNGIEMMVGQYHHASNLVLCAVENCNLPLNFCSIDYHYSRRHSKLKLSNQNLLFITSKMEQFIQSDRIDVAKSYTKNISRQSQDAMPMLDIIEGFECLLCKDDNVYYCRKKVMMNSHYSRNHTGQTVMSRRVVVQCFNSKLKTPYFKVHTNAGRIIKNPNDTQSILKEHFIESKKTSAPAMSAQSPQAYILELQLEQAIQGMDPERVKNLVTEFNGVPYHCQIQDAFKNYFDHGYSLLNEPEKCSFLLKRLVRDPQQGIDSNKIMKPFQNQSTKTSYFQNGLSLLLFLFNCKYERKISGRHFMYI